MAQRRKKRNKKISIKSYYVWVSANTFTLIHVWKTFARLYITCRLMHMVKRYRSNSFGIKTNILPFLCSLTSQTVPDFHLHDDLTETGIPVFQHLKRFFSRTSLSQYWMKYLYISPYWSFGRFSKDIEFVFNKIMVLWNTRELLGLSIKGR